MAGCSVACPLIDLLEKVHTFKDVSFIPLITKPPQANASIQEPHVYNDINFYTNDKKGHEWEMENWQRVKAIAAKEACVLCGC